MGNPCFLSGQHKRFVTDIRNCLYNLDMEKQQSFYEDVRFLFISHPEHEGVRFQAYDDATGQPIKNGHPKKGCVTIGVGFNMDACGARKDWHAVFDHALSFEAAYQGKLSLCPKKVRALFHYSVKKRSSSLHHKIYKESWHALRGNERLAIEDAFFNGGAKLVGKSTRFFKAIQVFVQNQCPDDLSTAIYELRERSNPKKISGLTKRRAAEALLLESPLSEPRMAATQAIQG